MRCGPCVPATMREGISGGAVPGPQRRARHASGVRCFLQGDPALFHGLGGELSEQAVPVDLGRHEGIVAFEWVGGPGTPELGVVITVSSSHSERPYQLILS